MIDLTKKWKTRNGWPVKNLTVAPDGMIEGDLHRPDRAYHDSFRWYLDGTIPAFSRDCFLNLVPDEDEVRAPSVGQMIWHPAETAPKDGAVILAWFPVMGWPEAIQWVKFPEEYVARYGEGYWAYANDLLQDAQVRDAYTFIFWTPITKPEGME